MSELSDAGYVARRAVRTTLADVAVGYSVSNDIESDHRNISAVEFLVGSLGM